MNNIANRGGTGKIFSETDRNQLDRTTVSGKRSASPEELLGIGNTYHKNNQLGMLRSA